MSQQESDSELDHKKAGEAAMEGSTDPAVVAAAASVLFSWHEFFLKGNKSLGIFIGLWPPTILAFASYLKETSASKKMQEAKEE